MRLTTSPARSPTSPGDAVEPGSRSRIAEPRDEVHTTHDIEKALVLAATAIGGR